MSAVLGRIDVHHHIVPQEYVQALAECGVADAGGMPFPPWDVGSTLDMMNRLHIDVAFTSISCPGVYFGDIDFARKLSRRCNEASASLVSDYPRRFGAFAVVPLPDTEAALLELEYALDTLKLDGVALLTSVDGRYLGDSAFAPVFEELNRRKTVVFVHPSVPPDCDTGRLILPPSLLEFTFDTTRAVASLLYSGTFERCPDVRFIFCHAGGAVPYLAWRLSLGEWLPGMRQMVPEGVITYLRRLHYDTALSSSRYALRSLQELAEPSRILFGSDYPFLPEPLVAMNISDLEGYDGFEPEALRGIERTNALALFPRLHQVQ